MAYSETRIVIGGLAHVPVLIFLANFIKGKFGIKNEEAKDTLVKEEQVEVIEVIDTLVKEEQVEVIEVKDTLVKEEQVEVIEVKDTFVKEGQAEAIKEISNKLDSIEQKADEVYQKVKKEKRIRYRKKKNN